LNPLAARRSDEPGSQRPRVAVLNLRDSTGKRRRKRNDFGPKSMHVVGQRPRPGDQPSTRRTGGPWRREPNRKRPEGRLRMNNAGSLQDRGHEGDPVEHGEQGDLLLRNDPGRSV
jgi:hypothetical protein